MRRIRTKVLKYVCEDSTLQTDQHKHNYEKQARQNKKKYKIKNIFKITQAGYILAKFKVNAANYC